MDRDTNTEPQPHAHPENYTTHHKCPILPTYVAPKTDAAGLAPQSSRGLHWAQTQAGIH